MKPTYRPSDLNFYTTWWLTSKSSSLSHTATTLSVRNAAELDDQCTIQQVIIYIIIYVL